MIDASAKIQVDVADVVGVAVLDVVEGMLSAFRWQLVINVRCRFCNGSASGYANAHSSEAKGFR